MSLVRREIAMDNDYDNARRILNNLDWEDEFCLLLQALREKQDREENKPLTLAKLKQMKGRPVWIVFIPSGKGWWDVIDDFWNCADGTIMMSTAKHHNVYFRKYGVDYIAYAHKPKEEK